MRMSMISDNAEERNRTPDWAARQFEGPQWMNVRLP
jgi:hypothetical protein